MASQQLLLQSLENGETPTSDSNVEVIDIDTVAVDNPKVLNQKEEELTPEELEQINAKDLMEIFDDEFGTDNAEEPPAKKVAIDQESTEPEGVKVEDDKIYVAQLGKPFIINSDSCMGVGVSQIIFLGKCVPQPLGMCFDRKTLLRLPYFKMFDLLSFMLEALGILKDHNTFENHELTEDLIKSSENNKIVMSRQFYAGQNRVAIRTKWRPNSSNAKRDGNKLPLDDGGYAYGKIGVSFLPEDIRQFIACSGELVLEAMNTESSKTVVTKTLENFKKILKESPNPERDGLDLIRRMGQNEDPDCLQRIEVCKSLVPIAPSNFSYATFIHTLKRDYRIFIALAYPEIYKHLWISANKISQKRFYWQQNQ